MAKFLESSTSEGTARSLQQVISNLNATADRQSQELIAGAQIDAQKEMSKAQIEADAKRQQTQIDAEAELQKKANEAQSENYKRLNETNLKISEQEGQTRKDINDANIEAQREERERDRKFEEEQLNRHRDIERERRRTQIEAKRRTREGNKEAATELSNRAEELGKEARKTKSVLEAFKVYRGSVAPGAEAFKGEIFNALEGAKQQEMARVSGVRDQTVSALAGLAGSKELLSKDYIDELNPTPVVGAATKLFVNRKADIGAVVDTVVEAAFPGLDKQTLEDGTNEADLVKQLIRASISQEGDRVAMLADRIRQETGINELDLQALSTAMDEFGHALVRGQDLNTLLGDSADGLSEHALDELKELGGKLIGVDEMFVEHGNITGQLTGDDEMKDMANGLVEIALQTNSNAEDALDFLADFMDENGDMPKWAEEAFEEKKILGFVKDYHKARKRSVERALDQTGIDITGKREADFRQALASIEDESAAVARETVELSAQQEIDELDALLDGLDAEEAASDKR